jgi:hypothetical protein
MCDTKITSIHKSIVQGTDRIVKFIGLNLDKVSHIDLISSFATMEWQLEDNNTIIITLNAPQPETISFTVLINDDDGLRLKSDGTALEVKILPGPQITYWPDQIKVGNCRSLTVNGRNLTQDGIFEVIDDSNSAKATIMSQYISRGKKGKLLISTENTGLFKLKYTQLDFNYTSESIEVFEKKFNWCKLLPYAITLTVMISLILIMNWQKPDGMTIKIKEVPLKITPNELTTIFIETNNPLQLNQQHHFVFPTDVNQIGDTELMSDLTYAIRVIADSSCQGVRTVYLNGSQASFELECK